MRKNETNEERRTRKLEKLARDRDGGLEGIAADAGVSLAYLEQLINVTLLPPKKDGTRSRRRMDDAMARKIEQTCGLPVGWFDWPFDGVDIDLYHSLDEREKGAVEAAMSSAIAEHFAKKGKRRRA